MEKGASARSTGIEKDANSRRRHQRLRQLGFATVAILLVAARYFFAQTSQAESTALPLGTLSFSATAADCPVGDYSCSSFKVSCPEVTKAEPGHLAIGAGQGTPKGVIMFFTGGEGDGWWTEQGKAIDPEGFIADLRARGYTVAQVRWSDWLTADKNKPGTPGHDRLGCRPATLIKYVHDMYYQPLRVTPATVGECGFCITGNSGGSWQVAYALSHYGLDAILDAVIPTDGPPHSVLEKACLRIPGEDAYWYDSLRSFIDQGFAYFNRTGPCVTTDESFRPQWKAASIATGGNDYFHPTTRVHFIFSTDGMRTNGGDYVARLLEAGSPLVMREDATSTPHNVMEGADGRDKLMAAIFYTGDPRSPPSPTPPAEEDSQAPAVTISSPAHQSTLSGEVTVAATATDDVGVVRMEAYIDGNLRATAPTGSITYSWDTAPVSSGSHSIAVRAFDAAGNASHHKVTVHK